jgi:hypothetical protein
VIVLSNLGSVNPNALANRVIDIYLADQCAPGEKTAETESLKEKTISVDSEVFDLYEGKYQLEVGLILDIIKENNTLWVQVAGQPKIELQPVSETKYYIEMIGAHVTFTKDKAGEVTGMTLHQGNRDIKGKRLEESVLSTDQMEEYAGEYYSEELRAIYTLSVDKGKLYAQIGKKDKIELSVTKEDAFAGSMFTGTFERNADGLIAGFSLDAGRVKNLQFVRKTP